MKIKRELFKKIISYTKDETSKRVIPFCTASEISLIFYFVRLQDNLGRASSIYYKDACQAIGEKMSIANFYKIMYILESKGIISINSSSTHGYWDITIHDNSFISKEKDYAAGYVNINKSFLYSPKFLKASWGIKVICLNYMLQPNERYEINIKFETLLNWTGYNRITIMRYIKTIKSIFNDVITDAVRDDVDKIYIRAQALEKKKCFDTELFNEHDVATICRKNKIKEDKSNINDVAKLFDTFQKQPRLFVKEAIEYCLKKHKKLLRNYISNIIKRMKHGSFQFDI